MSMKLLRRRVALGLLTPAVLAALSAPQAIAEYRTIVGHWAAGSRDCSRVSGGLHIRPMSIEGDGAHCHFSNVRRTGDTVVWNGRCDAFGEEFPATVTARSAGGRLTVDFNGTDRRGPFERCGR
ncbi:hypothetical protein [Methylosinus sp. RM1]|uniref:hypothetical protein n=1 Tax=Methylosinus sp. RM1 TaxID=2583817 RepID=UPI00140A1796|nr:hypothetical protein [Methylosinus sp. RM1]